MDLDSYYEMLNAFFTVCVVYHKMAAKGLSFEYGKGR